MVDESWRLRLAALQEEAQSSRYGFASIHVDDLRLSIDVQSGAAIAELLRACQAHLGWGNGTGRIQLAIPIGVTDQLDASLPERLPPADGDEPPSLYYFDLKHWLMASDREEYRCPCDIPDLTDQGLTASYSCGRSVVDRVRGWEFSKTIWVWTSP